MSNKKLKRGFTLIEVLIVIGILAILAGIALVAINPARQFSQARDSQRLSHVNTILNAIVQNIAENRGTFKCNGAEKSIPATEVTVKAPEGTDGLDLYDCLVPKYIPDIVQDPETGTFTSNTAYNTGYKIIRDSGSGRVTISAVAEITENSPIKATK
ncbi:MAG: type II secretion system protein [Patescibacteria group bacterium]